MTRRTIDLGYAVGTGEPVTIPLAHTAVTGQTQASGKTTTLEALISRAGDVRAVAFVTKRGESGFSKGTAAPAFFRERADWQFVASVLEAAMRERMRFERAWIMRASKGAQSLRDVQRNVKKALESAKGLSADVYFTLDNYLDIVVPQIDRLDYTEELKLADGLNVMDLTGYSTELQALVIRSVLEEVLEKFTKTICVLPEAWEFIPQNRGSPVKLAAETLIRKGAALQNFVWLDSQDIAGVHKDILRSIGVWILGVQREANEIKRLLDHIPSPGSKVKPDQISTLGRGQFYVCHGREVVKTYVRPAWMTQSDAHRIATGVMTIEDAPSSPFAAVHREAVRDLAESVDRKVMPPVNPTAGDIEMTPEQVKEIVGHAAREFALVIGPQLAGRAPNTQVVEPPPPAAKGRGKDVVVPAAPAAPPTPAHPIGDIEGIYQQVKQRLSQEAPGLLKLLVTAPELEVSVERHVISADGKSLKGRAGILIKNGFLKEPKRHADIKREMERTGTEVNSGNLATALADLVKYGFLTREGDGYQAVAGMKVNIKDA